MRHKRREKSNRGIAFEMRVSVSTVKSYWLTHGEYLPIRKRGEKGEEVSSLTATTGTETILKA